jgi:hypothetical protein
MATMELASIPREFPQFGRHLTSLVRPASEVFGQQGSRKGKGSCWCGGGKGSCGCGGDCECTTCKGGQEEHYVSSTRDLYANPNQIIEETATHTHTTVSRTNPHADGECPWFCHLAASDLQNCYDTIRLSGLDAWGWNSLLRFCKEQHGWYRRLCEFPDCPIVIAPRYKRYPLERCGPDVTDILVAHMNDVMHNKTQGRIGAIDASEANGWGRQGKEGNIGKSIERLRDPEGCGVGRCGGTATIAGECFSQYHIDHFLIMFYLWLIEGYNKAHILGMAQEYWSWDAAIDLEANDLFLELFENLNLPGAGLERTAIPSGRVTRDAVEKAMRKAWRIMKPYVYAAKPPRGTESPPRGRVYDYIQCAPCHIRLGPVPGLALP